MTLTPSRLPLLNLGLLVLFLVSLLWRGYGDTSTAVVLSSLVMFAVCLGSAVHLLGTRTAVRFVTAAVVFGWFAEQMGATHGWFFGSYDYTEVLGPRVGAVPFVIPLMWFALTYTGYVLANLIVWRAPVDGSPRIADAALMSLLAAMLVTAYDLGADPYMVFVLKAWIMTKKDGDWFGETVQGFVGWTVVTFFILMLFRMWVRKVPPVPATAFKRRDALVPVLVYTGMMAFQIAFGFPVETRSMALFVMGIPVLCALAGWRHWKTNEQDNEGETR